MLQQIHPRVSARAYRPTTYTQHQRDQTTVQSSRQSGCLVSIHTDPSIQQHLSRQGISEKVIPVHLEAAGTGRQLAEEQQAQKEHCTHPKGGAGIDGIGTVLCTNAGHPERRMV